MSSSSDDSSAGKIEGVTSTESFSMVVQKDDLGKNDYVEVKHEGKSYLLMVKELIRSGAKSIGTCTVVGMPPKTPFIPGSEVFPASEEAVRKGLGLETPEAEGVYLGKLSPLDINVWLPVKKLTRVFVVGKPGAGKSYTMGVIAEELIKKGIPIVIIDAHGEYSSLKVPADSPSDEFHVEPKAYSEQIIEFGDLAFNPGADIDISTLDSARPEDIVSQMQCTVINLRGLASEQQYTIVLSLLKKLLEAVMVMQIPPFYLALDEAHLFAGRSKGTGVVKDTLEIVKRFAQEGRKFGANMIVLTQRPQLLDMTVRSLSATWIIHRLSDPNDVRIAVESGGLGKEWEADINWLESGHTVVTGDIVERIPLLVKIRSRETKHGAPGFNALDFVSPEEREKMRRRMSALKDKLVKMRASPGLPPQLPPTLPALYMPVKIDEQAQLGVLKENPSLDAVEILKSELRYMPALFSEVSVTSNRKNPEITFNERLRRLVPADSSVPMIDWRHESAYNLVAKEVIEASPSPDPSREGSHGQLSTVVIEGVDTMKGPLKTFIASKLTQTIMFHKELGEYSKPGESLDQFRSRLSEKIEERKKARVSEIESAYAAKIGEAKAQVKGKREEYESIEKLINGINSELKALEKEKAKATKEGKSTLKIAAQIQTREARLSRLQRRITELGDQMGRHHKDEELQENTMKADIAKVNLELDALLGAPLQSMVFQPKAEEVEVEALQLVWVPVIEGLFRASFGGTASDFRFEWNAVNGRGIFGTCSKCGVTIESLEGGLFCSKCGEMYCTDHLKVCSVCGRGVCSEHAWSCPECGKLYCADEAAAECTVCGKKLCKACAVACSGCPPDKSYCPKHLKECPVCKNAYCPEHYKEHVAYCAKCGKELCTVEQVKCTICGEVFCEADVTQCYKCGEEVCNKDTWSCSSCGKVFCADELSLACGTCGAKVCESCVTYCKECGAPMCKNDIKVCQVCGGKVCSSCITETKKLGLFRKSMCISCSKK